MNRAITVTRSTVNKSKHYSFVTTTVIQYVLQQENYALFFLIFSNFCLKICPPPSPIIKPKCLTIPPCFTSNVCLKNVNIFTTWHRSTVPPSKILQPSLPAVSYTHLDVYKRQIHMLFSLFNL